MEVMVQNRVAPFYRLRCIMSAQILVELWFGWVQGRQSLEANISTCPFSEHHMTAGRAKQKKAKNFLTCLVCCHSTRSNVLWRKCNRFIFGQGSTVDAAGGAYGAPQTPQLAGERIPPAYGPPYTRRLQRLDLQYCVTFLANLEYGLFMSRL